MTLTERPTDNTTAPFKQDEITFPPGRVGTRARFIYDHAPYSSMTVAIAGSLAYQSALCGRFVNVSGTGLNIWMAIVGGTGIGKEAANSGISKLVSHIARKTPCAHEFIGPSSLASPEAAHKRVAKTPSVLVFIGELGIKLKIWCAPNANAVYAGLVAFLLDVFSKSGHGNRLGARENSDKDKGAAAVESPNLALLGDTTESTLLEALSEPNLANGFIPRWIFAFAGEQRAPANKNRQHSPSDELIEYEANLAATSLSYQQSGTVYDIKLSAEAQAIDDEIEAYTSSKISPSQSEITKHLYSRARLNILKIAALIACGDNQQSFEITASHMLWARRFVLDGIDHVLSKFESGEVGQIAGNQTKQEREVLRIIKEYGVKAWNEKYHGTEEMHRRLVITQAHIQQRLSPTAAFREDSRGAKDAILRTLKSLLEADIIREIPTAQMISQFGSHPRAFAISDPGAVLRV